MTRDLIPLGSSLVLLATGCVWPLDVAFTDHFSPRGSLHQPYVVGARVRVTAMVSARTEDPRAPMELRSSDPSVVRVVSFNGVSYGNARAGVEAEVEAVAAGSARLEAVNIADIVVGEQEVTVRRPDGVSASYLPYVFLRHDTLDARVNNLVLMRGVDVQLVMTWWDGGTRLWGRTGQVPRAPGCTVESVPHFREPFADPGIAQADQLKVRCDTPATLTWEGATDLTLAAGVVSEIGTLLLETHADDGVALARALDGLGNDVLGVAAEYTLRRDPAGDDEMRPDPVVRWTRGSEPATLTATHGAATTVAAVDVASEMEPQATCPCVDLPGAIPWLVLAWLLGVRFRGRAVQART